MIKSDYCLECGKELVDSVRFCDISCEESYRNDRKELYILTTDGKRDYVCPVLKFEETEDELICENCCYEYRFFKKDIAKWKIDRCRCFTEFTTVDEL